MRDLGFRKAVDARIHMHIRLRLLKQRQITKTSNTNHTCLQAQVLGCSVCAACMQEQRYVAREYSLWVFPRLYMRGFVLGEHTSTTFKVTSLVDGNNGL